ncbi:helix-turn-helix transcriptional regulator [Pedobacter frigoris]|uniref:AraC family transcriptional regulator n=1 Tax=Pedobacter frigoris TaxID=2571272 RepID=UPI00292FADFE|nr:helix-turn-helix transcriptional regulator [Pedobacter frigoris]
MGTKTVIPEFSLLEIVTSELKDQEKTELDYFVASFSSPMQLSKFPHRASYFGIAVCTRGSATLFANLEQYHLSPGSLIAMEPGVIRSWDAQSDGYAEEVLFFTGPFLLETIKQLDLLKGFRFFQHETLKVIQINNEEVSLVNGLLQDIKKRTNSPNHYKNEIIRSYINIVLHEVAGLYDRYDREEFVRSNIQSTMVMRFKQLLVQKHLQLRTVNGYAELLNVTPKHLSETVKATTGKTARDWIHHIIILESKAKLKQTSLSITQIADALNFSDASLFGKYFKRYAGYSPASYRKRLAQQEDVV